MSETFHTETTSFDQMKSVLGADGMKLLEDQLNTYHELNDRKLESPLREAIASGETRLPKGTLLHSMGMYAYSADAVMGVAQRGIVSGELIGISEDSETHGCADFFKVPEDMTIEEYMDWAKEPVIKGNLRTLKGERLVRRGITFIVDPKAEGMDDLLQNDAYLNESMRKFVNPPSGRGSEDTAAILGGVPRGAIAGVLISDKLAERRDVLEVLSGTMPNVPVLNNRGSTLQQQAA